MKIYNLHIYFKPSWNTYNKITEILNVVPEKFEKSKFDVSEKPSIWSFQLVEEEDEKNIDFINVFLDILEPNFPKLKTLGIEKKDILFWLIYEYQYQCAMEFHPQEMKRIGESGIGLNIDCFDRLITNT